MKFALLLAVFLTLGLCSVWAWPNGQSSRYTGQPGCQTEQELQVGVYRHFKRKDAYWQCTTLGQPASMQYCKNEEGYLDDQKQCVLWKDWYYTPTVMPPT
ncbi:CG14245, partial [Drosophila busckii]